MSAVLPWTERTGLGCQRLAALPDEDAARVVQAALKAGVTVFDTADAYHLPARGGGRAHDGERQLARLLSDHLSPGDLIIATKVGLVQTGARWREVGTRKHILAEAAKSRAALGIEALDILQLHAFDPRTKPRTSLRALQHAKEQGLAARIGLCNVTVTALARALDEAEVDVVQVPLDVWNTDAIRGGLLDFARARGIDVIGYRPLGGVAGARRLGKDHALRAATHRPQAAAFTFLRDRVPDAVLLPGPSTAAHLADLMEPERNAHDVLDRRHPAFSLVARPILSRRPATFREGDVVVIMGAPGAGKTVRAEHYEQQGYARLNRDKRGGRLSDLLAPLDEILAGESPRVVLDNTYQTRAQRNPIVEKAFAHRIAPRVEWVDTDVDRCLAGVAQRLIAQTGYLPGPDELKALRAKNPQAFGPRVVRDYFRDLEPPGQAEGFVNVERMPRPPQERQGAMVWVLDADGDAMATGTLDPAVRTHCDNGGLVVLTMYRPGARPEAIDAEQERWRARWGQGVAFAVCVHRPPPRCWCMKPLPGAVIEALIAHDARSRPGLVVGQSAADQTLARRLGFVCRSAPV